MINKRLINNRPKIVLYVLGIIAISIILSGATLLATKLKFLGPMTAVSTESTKSADIATNGPTAEYKQLVTNEINKVTTISAELKAADGWLNLELPKINLVIDFNK